MVAGLHPTFTSLDIAAWSTTEVYVLVASQASSSATISIKVRIELMIRIQRFASDDFMLGHFEVPPYSPDTIRSSFHVRQYELYKLSLVMTSF